MFGSFHHTHKITCRALINKFIFTNIVTNIKNLQNIHYYQYPSYHPKFLGYPGEPEKGQRYDGVPGYPKGTQWVVDGVQPCRLHKGKHLMYLDATTGGQSGSPLYFIEKILGQLKAFVIGVHVGGTGRIHFNSAVPISNIPKYQTSSQYLGK